MFGVDKRLNTWTDRFRTCCRISRALSRPTQRHRGVEYPQSDVVVHLAAHAKVHELVRDPHRACKT